MKQDYEKKIQLFLVMNGLEKHALKHYNWHCAERFYEGLCGGDEHVFLDYYIKSTHRRGCRAGKGQEKGKLGWETAIGYSRTHYCDQVRLLNDLLPHWYYSSDAIQGAACRIFRGEPAYEKPEAKTRRKQWARAKYRNEWDYDGWFVTDMLAFVLLNECGIKRERAEWAQPW